MLILVCNNVELLRLRRLLLNAVIQTKQLQNVFEAQNKLTNGQGKVFFDSPLNFEDTGIEKSLLDISFVDDGNLTDVDIDLAVNEFDPSLRANLDFADPENFKILICPMGLEELRATLHYQLMVLQQLVVAVRHNQVLLDDS